MDGGPETEQGREYALELVREYRFREAKGAGGEPGGLKIERRAKTKILNDLAPLSVESV